MRSIPAAIQAALQEPVINLAWCARLTRLDGKVFAFTEHDRPLLVGGVIHEPTYGANLSALVSGAGLAVDNSEMLAFLDSSLISENELIAGVFDGAALVLTLVDWTQPEVGEVIISSGTIGEVSTADGQFRAEFRSLAQQLQQSIGRRVVLECDVAVLGDARCNANLGAFTHAATVTALQSDVAFVVDVGGVGAGDNQYFRYGTVSWQAPSQNLQRDYRITAWNGTTTAVQIDRKTPYPIQVGDPLTMVAGCDRRSTTCKTKFNNFVNFRGFPHVPGRDSFLERPDPK